MADEANPGDLFKIKVDATGAELAVGNKVPSLIDRFLPSSWTSKRKIDAAINENILRKIGADKILDENELEFLSTICSEHGYRLLRQRSIQARAMKYVEESPVQRLIAEGSDVTPKVAEKNSETSDQWITRLREDAGGVASEELGELYARILAEECMKPNSVSLRTLGVLRYLDAATLASFEKLQAIVVDEYTPRYQTSPGNEMFEYFGISHHEVLLLEDAGLISLVDTEIRLRDMPAILPCRAFGTTFVAIRKEPGHSALSVTPLTLAGAELSRISQRKEDRSDLPQIGKWLKGQLRESHKLYYVEEVLSEDADVENLNMREWIIEV